MIFICTFLFWMVVWDNNSRYTYLSTYRFTLCSKLEPYLVFIWCSFELPHYHYFISNILFFNDYFWVMDSLLWIGVKQHNTNMKYKQKNINNNMQMPWKYVSRENWSCFDHYSFFFCSMINRIVFLRKCELYAKKIISWLFTLKS